MLTIPHNGIDVFSAPPPSADTPENPKHRQLMYITLNDDILAQISAARGKGLSVTFGGSNAVSLLIPYHLRLYSCFNRANLTIFSLQR
jgi:hypothetical protein